MTDLDVTQFIKDTRIDPVDLDDAFIKQSSIRAYWGAIAAEAEAKAVRAKMARDSKEALVSKKYRDDAAVTGAKLTEKALDSMVKLDPEYIKACHEFVDADLQANIARSFVASLADRKDMLVQIGADRRDETKGQMRMMQANAFNNAQEAIRQNYGFGNNPQC